MADNTINVRIKDRSDTEANWTSKNPVLLKGERAITDGTAKYKIGDGKNTWSALPYYEAMTFADRTKLNGIASGANKTTVDSSLSSSSTNPVQNKIINDAFSKKANSTLSSYKDIMVNLADNCVFPEPLSLAASPFSRDLWHDHFAFLSEYSILSTEKTINGETWVDSSENIKNLFIQKEKTDIAILTSDIVGARFILYSNSLSYSMIKWIEIGVSYTYPFSEFDIIIERSTDGKTWNTFHSSSIKNSAQPYFLFVGNNFCDNYPYVRFSFKKTSNLTTGKVSIVSLKGFTIRKGNQGLGIENEFPYDWDCDRNIYPHNDNECTLGIPRRRWKNIYAENFVGTASAVPWSGITGKPSTYTPSSHTHNYAGSSSAGGSANSAVKLDTTTSGSATQPVYFSGGKPVACTYTLGKSVPSNAVFTDTNTWRPLGTGANQACAGNDSRLSNSRPASDVYAWAKASTKPSYSWGEINEKPVTFTPSAHSHVVCQSTEPSGQNNGDLWFKEE